MNKERDYVVVMSSAASEDEAKKLATTLLEKRLVACVNILPQARSLYWWKGSVEEGDESLLMMKTTAKCVAQIEACFAQVHSYEVPELIQLPITGGSSAYLEWVAQSLQPEGDR